MYECADVQLGMIQSQKVRKIQHLWRVFFFVLCFPCDKRSLFYLHLHPVCRLVCWSSGSRSNRPWTITKEIISSVLLRLRSVSGYISAAVLPLSPLARFNFLYALFCWLDSVCVCVRACVCFFFFFLSSSTKPRLCFHVCF